MWQVRQGVRGCGWGARQGRIDAPAEACLALRQAHTAAVTLVAAAAQLGGPSPVPNATIHFSVTTRQNAGGSASFRVARGRQAPHIGPAGAGGQLGCKPQSRCGAGRQAYQQQRSQHHQRPASSGGSGCSGSSGCRAAPLAPRRPPAALLRHARCAAAPACMHWVPEYHHNRCSSLWTPLHAPLV